jgi:hypothetical protein
MAVAQRQRLVEVRRLAVVPHHLRLRDDGKKYGNYGK